MRISTLRISESAVYAIRGGSIRDGKTGTSVVKLVRKSGKYCDLLYVEPVALSLMADQLTSSSYSLSSLALFLLDTDTPTLTRPAVTTTSSLIAFNGK